jgi:hypothetical protein
VSEPCNCGAEDCPRCFPRQRVRQDRDPEPEYTSRSEANEQADRAAMRWHDMREKQAERREY